MKERKSYSRFIQNVCSWKNLEKGRIIHLLHHCIAHDISTFDSADFQGNHCIAKTFGTALSESGLSRDEIQLISKFNDATGSPGFVEAVDDILLRLRTDYLDLLLIDSPAPSGELLQDIQRLSSQGKILEIGAMSAQHQKLAATGIPLRTYQDRIDFSPESFKDLSSKELTSGTLTCFTWLDLEKMAQTGKSDVLDQFCHKYKLSRTQLLFAWTLQHPAYLHPVLLSSEKDEISSTTAMKEVDLDPFDWQEINLFLT